MSRRLSLQAASAIARVHRAIAEAGTDPVHVPSTLGPESPLRRGPQLARRRPIEEQEQIHLFDLIFGRVGAGEDFTTPRPGLPAELGLLYAIPNGGLRSKATAARLKASGVRRGFPDFALPVARGGFHGLFCEFKATHGRTPRPEQRAWLMSLASHGNLAVSARGTAAALALLLTYLRMGETRTPAVEALGHIDGVTLYPGQP